MFSELKVNKEKIYIYEDRKGILRYESKIDNRKGIIHIHWDNIKNKNIYYIKMCGKNFIIDL